MIIQMNATVCAAEDHGEDGRHEIAGSDRRRSAQAGQEGTSGQEKQELKECGRNAGPSGAGGPAMPLAPR
jgi:hypothetical protein